MNSMKVKTANKQCWGGGGGGGKTRRPGMPDKPALKTEMSGSDLAERRSGVLALLLLLPVGYFVVVAIRAIRLSLCISLPKR